MKSISQDYQKERIKNNQKFLLKLLHLHIGNYYPLRKWLGVPKKNLNAIRFEHNKGEREENNQKIKSFLTRIGVGLILTLVFSIKGIVVFILATLYENYTTTSTHTWDSHTVYWGAQTFTPVTAHTITSVKLLLLRTGPPGTINVSIQGTTAGKPDGNVLCSGTTDGNTLPTASPYEWREITLGAGYELTDGVMYCIVIKALSGDASNKVGWRMNIDGGYTVGNHISTSNSGVNWTINAYDYLFEEWGTAPQNYYQTCPEVVKVLPVNSFNTSRILNEAIIIISSKISQVARVFTETIKTVGSIIRDAGRTLSDILIIGDLPIDIISIFFQTLTEIVKVVSTIGNSIARVFTETIKIVGSLFNQATFYKVLAEAIQVVGQMVRNVGRIFIEMFTTSLVFSTIATLLKTLTESITVIGSRLYEISRTFIEVVIVGVVFQTVLTAYKTLTEDIKIISSKLTEMARTFLESIIANSHYNDFHSRNLLEHIVVLPVLGSFVIGKLLIQSVKIIGDLLFSTTRVFTETINVIGQRIFLLSKNLIETVTATIQQFNFSLAKIFNETIIVQWFKETYRAFVYLENLTVRVIFMPFVIGKRLIENIIGNASLLFGKTQFVVLTDIVKVGVSFVKTTTRTFLENIKLASDVIIRYMGRLFEERVIINGKGFQDEIHLLYGRVLYEIVNIIGALGSFAVGKLLPEVIKVYDSVAKASAWVMSETVKVVSSMVLLSGKIFIETVIIILSEVVDIGRIFIERAIIAPVIGFKHISYQILTDSVKVVVNIVRITGRTFYEAISMSIDIISFAVSRIFIEPIKIALSFVIGGTFYKVFTEGISIIVNMFNQVGKIFIENIQAVSQFIRGTISKLFVQPIKVLSSNLNVWQLGRLYSETIKVAGNVVSQSVKIFTEIINLTGTFILGTISKLFIEVVKISFIITKSLPKVFTENIKVVGSAIIQGVKVCIETVVVGGQFILGTISKLLIETIQIIETYLKAWTLGRVFTGTIKVVVSAFLEGGRIFTEIVSVVGTFILGTISKLLIETVVIGQVVITTIVRIFSEVIIISANIVNQIGRIFVEVVSVVGAMGGFVIGKILNEVVIIGETFIRVISRIFTQSFIVIGEIYRLGSEYIFYETIQVVGSRIMMIGRTLQEVISVGWAKIKLVLNGIQVGLWKKVARVTGGIWRKISRNDN